MKFSMLVACFLALIISSVGQDIQIGSPAAESVSPSNTDSSVAPAVSSEASNPPDLVNKVEEPADTANGGSNSSVAGSSQISVENRASEGLSEPQQPFVPVVELARGSLTNDQPTAIASDTYGHSRVPSRESIEVKQSMFDSPDDTSRNFGLLRSREAEIAEAEERLHSDRRTARLRNSTGREYRFGRGANKPKGIFFGGRRFPEGLINVGARARFGGLGTSRARGRFRRLVDSVYEWMSSEAQASVERTSTFLSRRV